MDITGIIRKPGPFFFDGFLTPSVGSTLTSLASRAHHHYLGRAGLLRRANYAGYIGLCDLGGAARHWLTRFRQGQAGA